MFNFPHNRCVYLLLYRRYGIKRDRRKLHIEPLHLPPEESRASTSAHGPCSGGSVDLENIVSTDSQRELSSSLLSHSTISTMLPSQLNTSRDNSSASLCLGGNQMTESTTNSARRLSKLNLDVTTDEPKQPLLSTYIPKPINISTFKRSNNAFQTNGISNNIVEKSILESKLKSKSTVDF